VLHSVLHSVLQPVLHSRSMSTSIDVEKRDSLCHIIDIYLSDRQEERYKDRQRKREDVICHVIKHGTLDVS